MDFFTCFFQATGFFSSWSSSELKQMTGLKNGQSGVSNRGDSPKLLSVMNAQKEDETSANDDRCFIGKIIFLQEWVVHSYLVKGTRQKIKKEKNYAI
ncbi:hypothetical protein EBR43_00605 [bacterium]|nr:hypothetical protein [bacterium]NBW56289.1 hypothetical protein [bacterium]NBX71830.1 hypothetical protein [bacterium]